jgi:hypothetical protein
MNLEIGNEPRSFISENICFEFSVQCNLLHLGRTRKNIIVQPFFISKYLLTEYWAEFDWKQHEKLAGTWQTFGLEN